MLLYPVWYRNFGVRRPSQLARPVLSLLSTLELPRSAVVHYPPENDLAIGPDSDELLIRDPDRVVYVDHVVELQGDKGPPRSTHQPPTRFIKDYHRRNRRLKLLRNLENSVSNERNVLVENYGILPQLYRYNVNFFTSYYKWYNMRATLWAKVAEMAKTVGRQQFIPCKLPTVIPTLQQLKRGERSQDRNTLELFSNPERLDVLDIWTWLGTQRSQTPMGKLPAEALDHINLVWIHGDRWCVMNLGILNGWRMAIPDDPAPGSANGLPVDLIQKHFLRSLMSMVESQSEASVVPEAPGAQPVEPTVQSPAAELGIPTANDTLAALKQESVVLFEEDLQKQDEWVIEELNLDAELDALNALLNSAPEAEQVVGDPAPTFETQGYAAGVISRADALADQGQLSGAEYKRFMALADSYKNIPNPYGKGTLAEHAVITPEMLSMQGAPKLPDIPGVLDKSMLASSLIEFDSRYINNILSRDVLNSVLAVQNAGVAVTDYKVEIIEDVMNHYESHTVKLVPVSGQPSTIRFRVPVVNAEGVYRSGGVQYRLRKQRGDRPIRKVNSSRVALTSYYGKTFVERSTKRANAYPEWLTNQIQALEFQAEGSTEGVHDVHTSPLYDPAWDVPRLYSILAGRFKSFRVGRYEFFMDYPNRQTYFGAEAVKAAETEGVVVIGRQGQKLVVVDRNNALYVYEPNGLKDIGTMEDLLQVDFEKAPLEQAELKVFSKTIPLGMVLGYYIGLDTLVSRLDLQNFRKVPTGERLNLQKGEFAIRFVDEAYVFHRDEPMAVLLFSGYDQYYRSIRRYSSNDFNSKDVYLNVLESSGLGIRYLRELDMLQNMFVDGITRDLLVEMGEPTDWVGLMFRSAELLLKDQSATETDMQQMRIKGYERIAGQVYKELSQAVRVYNARIGAGSNKVEMSPSAVWTSIQEDASKALVEESNPIQNLREQEVVTYGGTGGRSRRSMVKGSRVYVKSDEGVISEATVDSGDVAIISYLTANPNFNSLRGTTGLFDPSGPGGATQLLSTAALLAPESTRDDPKRTNFVGIQHGSAIMAKGCKPFPLRTGYEQVLTHRVGDLFAYTSKQDGVVKAVSGKVATFEYADGSTVNIEIGRRFGTAAGSTFPHEVVCRVQPGQKFKAGEVLTYNSSYFQLDPLNPTQAVWKGGVLARTALMECADTLEDSSVISERIAELLTTQSTKPRDVVVRFDQHIHGLVKIGSDVDPETILCTIEDAVTADNDLFDQNTLETLQNLGGQAPTAKYAGRVEKIEVFYNGDLDDMSPSLRALAEAADREEAKMRKSMGKTVFTRRVDSSQRIDGNPLEIDSFAIRVYITADVPAGVGDKGVFGNQLKTIFGRVMSGVNRTQSGLDLDAFFAYQSISARIVTSPDTMGTTNTLLRVCSQRMAQAYRG